jgi:hypothetical protein
MYSCVECGDVIHGVCTTVGDEFGFAMTENQNGLLARHARDFAEDKSVGDEIPEHGDGLLRKAFDEVFQPA